ncbi:alpha/beta hydrolase [archaeon]|nr:alpha/beta hydrolase [archaeon]
MTAKIQYSDNTLTIDTKNGAVLKGDFYDNTSKNGVILLPGFTEHRSTLDNLAQELSKDFKVWSFDLNSQGESTGNWDLHQMKESFYEIQDALKKKHKLKKLGAHGNSLGGMTVGLVTAEGVLDCICLTSTPAGLQDVLKETFRRKLEKVPNKIARYGMIAFEAVASKLSDKHKKAYEQIKAQKSLKNQIQFGAAKFYDVHQAIHWVDNAPRLDAQVQRITQPVLVIYGGSDLFLGIKDSTLPEVLRKMYEQIDSKNKDLLIIPGAGHSLELLERGEALWGRHPKYRFVKEIIAKHFREHLG